VPDGSDVGAATKQLSGQRRGRNEKGQGEEGPASKKGELLLYVCGCLRACMCMYLCVRACVCV